MYKYETRTAEYKMCVIESDPGVKKYQTPDVDVLVYASST